MSSIDTENAVLASFLYADDMGTDTSKAFLLSEYAFTSSFRKRVATKINASTSIDKFYSLLSFEIEESVSGSTYEQMWIDILAQTPLPLTLAQRYHSKLSDEYKYKMMVA